MRCTPQAARKGPVAPFELKGHVARLTESGFAVRYELFDPEIRRLVDDVNAIVAEPATV